MKKLTNGNKETGDQADQKETDVHEVIDTGLFCILILSRFFGLPADGNYLKHQYGCSGETFAVPEILRSLKKLGFKSREITSEVSRLNKTPFPAIAEHKDGHFFIIAKYEGDQLLIQDPLVNKPVAITIDELQEIWSGKLVLVTKRAKLGDELRKFDIKWFIPAILKYKKFIGEVLLASFFIQLFGLVTPLFFQVIIDKVLVHKGFM